MSRALYGRTAALAAAAALALVAPIASASAAEPPPEIAARAYALVDAEDGQVLAQRAADQRSAIASATKLMTAYVASRSLPLSREVVAPSYQALDAESLLGLQPGEQIQVRDLLYGLLLVSGNDAAVALAEASAGSVDAFVAKMNRAADRLELDGTSYANPIGLDDEGNFSTARDLVELTLELRDEEFFRRVFDTPTYVTRSGAEPRELVNRNTLVRTVPWIDGVKTGYTLGAGYVLVGSGERRGVELVSAVLGAPSEAGRDQATLALLEYGLSLYERHRPVRRGERLASVPVRAQDQTLALVARRPATLVSRDDQEIEVAVDAPAEVEGPLERGERVGTATVRVDGRPVVTVALAAATDVPAASLLERLDEGVPGPRAFVWALAFAALLAMVAAVLALRARGHRPPDPR